MIASAAVRALFSLRQQKRSRAIARSLADRGYNSNRFKMALEI